MSEIFYESLRPHELTEASRRAQEIKERGETKLLTIKREKEAPDKPEILVGARMHGAINALLPVITQLRERGYPISFLADQPSEKTILERFPEAEEQPVNPLSAFDERKPSLILIGNSINGGLGIEFYLNATAHFDSKKGDGHVPVVCVEDYPGASVRGQSEFNVFPDVVCTFDEGSIEFDKETLSADTSGKGADILKRTEFVATGSPAFDAMATENAQAVQEKLRRELGIQPGEQMITYVGDVPPDDLHNLETVITNLNKIDFGEHKPKFVARIHPAILKGRLEEYKQAYTALLASLTSCEVVNTMGVYSTDEVAQATDVVLSAYSTEGIKAAYRGKLPLFMLFPEHGGKGLMRETGMDTLPVIEKGAAAVARNKSDMESTLRALLLDSSFQENIRAAQQKYYMVDGKNADRVVSAIERALNK